MIPITNIKEVNEYIDQLLNACRDYRKELDAQTNDVSTLRDEIQSLREQLNNKQDRKYPSREWHKRNRKVLLK
jgi:cell division septum initiation protein DivIVA